jgi:hypothetical protein
MKIIPELALAFDTKKRAPFRVVFEAVRLSEIIKVRGVNDVHQEVSEPIEEEFKEETPGTLEEDQTLQDT